MNISLLLSASQVAGTCWRSSFDGWGYWSVSWNRNITDSCLNYNDIESQKSVSFARSNSWSAKK